MSPKSLRKVALYLEYIAFTLRREAGPVEVSASNAPLTDEQLDGWCIVYVPKHSACPVMTSNIADSEVAQMMADEMVKSDKGKIVAVCSASLLRAKLRAM